jgi:predicted flap endonuclease-1-like 5' DNA nuclease
MSTMTMRTQAHGHRCDCGCSSGKGECCELECLVQPRFFCGQLLTDQDLNALLEWTKGKTALSRYRDGWGIACGLDVHCSSAPGEEGFVSVTPGYALDCCGNDIIVCEEARVDLSAYCTADQDPCANWTPGAARGERAGGAANQTVSFSLWNLPATEVQAFDLFIAYAETVSDARNALARRACDAVEACEYTRTHEGYRIYAKPAEHCQSSAETRAMDWQADYRSKLQELFRELQPIAGIRDEAQKIARLAQWLTRRPLYSFCFIREWLCDLQRMETPTPGWFEQVIFWLVQDWRGYYFRCDCAGCGPDTGVPLARVWVWRRADATGRLRCKVIYIDPYPPFRRPLKLDCLPTLTGQVNLARYVWQPVEQTVEELRGLGFANVTQRPFNYNDVEGLRGQFAEESLFASRQENTLVVYSHADICEQPRVVRFAVAARPIKERIEVNAAPNNEETSATTEPNAATPPATDPSAGAAVRQTTNNSHLIIATNSAADPSVAPIVPPVVASPVSAIVVDPGLLPADHPLLDIERVKGIGPSYAARLAAVGIHNLRDLANSNAATVEQALSGGPPHLPADHLISDAADLLRKIREGN